MAQKDRIDETTQNTDMADMSRYPGTPRWVKVLGIISLVVVVLLGIMLLSGGHGPWRHMSSGESSGATPSVSAAEAHTPPMGHGGQ
jgi:hypothetical protein